MYMSMSYTGLARRNTWFVVGARVRVITLNTRVRGNSHPLLAQGACCAHWVRKGAAARAGA